MYVIKPTVPCLPKVIPSYNCCATIMVFLVRKFNLRAASCCRLLVVKGFAGFLLRSFFSTFLTSKSVLSILAVTSFTLCASGNFFFLPSIPQKFALNFLRAFLKLPSMLQYSSGTNSRISFSRSIIIFKATDWTRPALNPFLTLRQRIGLIE